jgi:hypothetical protein
MMRWMFLVTLVVHVILSHPPTPHTPHRGPHPPAPLPSLLPSSLLPPTTFNTIPSYLYEHDVSTLTSNKVDLLSFTKISISDDTMISLLLEIPKLMTGRIIRRSCHQFAWLLVVVVVLLSSSLICCLAPASASDTMAPVNNTAIEIFGYVPEYRFYINLNNTAPFLTDLIAFSVMPNADDDDDDDDDDAHVVLSCCLEKHHFEQIRQARASKTELNGGLSSPLRLWVTLGGAGRCEAFKSIASDSKRRKNLTSSLIALW